MALRQAAGRGTNLRAFSARFLATEANAKQASDDNQAKKPEKPEQPAPKAEKIEVVESKPSGLEARESKLSAPPPKSQRGSGGASGTIGFFLGLSVATGVGYYFLKNDYEQSTNTVSADMAKLLTSVDQIRDNLQRIENLERELKRLQSTSATKSNLNEVRTELLDSQERSEHSFLKTEAIVRKIEQEVLSLKTKSRDS